jgi:hypothetical protein
VGSSGAPGVVVIATPSAVSATTAGGNVLIRSIGGNVIYTFYSSGTITF